MSVNKMSDGNPSGVSKAQQNATINLDRLNSFPLNRSHATSFDLSKVIPVDHLRTVPRDVIDLNTEVRLLGNATSAPILSDIRQFVETYKVPYQAIYGRDWETVIGVVKDRGTAVPEDTRAYFSPSLLWTNLVSAFSFMYNVESPAWITASIKLLLAMRSVFTECSLLPYFNIHLHKNVYLNYYKDGVRCYLGTWMNHVFNNLFSSLKTEDIAFYVTLDDKVVYYHFNSTSAIPDNTKNIVIVESVSHMLEIFEQFPSFIFCTALGHTPIQGFDFSYFADGEDDLCQKLLSSSFVGVADTINFEPIVAYQLVISDKFSNNLVDNIYNSDKYMAALRGLITSVSVVADIVNSSYILDGDRYFYSPVSNNIFKQLTTQSGNNPYLFTMVSNYLLQIFSFGRSLRFGDYFTGSKLEPLANGNVNVSVEDGQVSAIEINQKEWLYSFLYNLHISSSEFKDYIRGIFGSDIKADRKDIIRLVRQERYLGKESIENTGTAQFNVSSTGSGLPITSVLRGSSLPAKLLYHSPESCILITVVWHDTNIYRSNSISRDAFIKTVLDEYIPENEFLGDQEVITHELDSSAPLRGIFSWNQRFAEYKMRYNFVSGAMLGDKGNNMLVTDSGYSFNAAVDNLSSDFIRQSILDYERFFPQNNYNTLPVHAYAKITSACNAKRPMYINPQPMR